MATKVFDEYRVFNYTYAGRPLVVETGKMAGLANGACMVRYGDTCILATATASASPREGIDFLPLSVDYNEKMYAVGKIPGGYLKREGKPSEKAILTSRVIDRPVRPLFPKDLRNDVALSLDVMSVDPDCSPEITAMIGASIALSISDIPWNGPIGGAFIGMVDGEFVVNPTAEQREKSILELTVAASMNKVVMIEAGAQEVADDDMFDAIMLAHKEIKELLDNGDFDQETLNQLVDIADKAGLVPALIEYLPQAINYGLQTFYENWDIMIEDIYSYNPDVTLVVLPVCNTDYVAPEVATPADSVKKMLVDALLSVANKPVIDGIEKFGYIYVDSTGAEFEGGHPTVDGHVFIANKILEALPDPSVCDQYTDIDVKASNYKAIEAMLLKGAMLPTTETTFEPDTVLTKAELKYALNVLTGAEVILDGETAAMRFNVAMAAANAALSGNFSFSAKFSALIYSIKYAFSGDITEKITRADAAEFFYGYINA